mgnify:FL=1
MSTEPKQSAPAAPSAAPKPAFKAPSSMARLKALQIAAHEAGVQKDARAILATIGPYIDVHGWCFPSPTMIAKFSGYTEKSVRKALLDLRRNGLVLSLDTDQWPLAVDEHQKTPKHLPMLLLWPAATHAARFAALWALSRKSRRLPNIRDLRWQWYLKTPTGDFGPYATAELGGYIAKESVVALDGWKAREATEATEYLPVRTFPILGMYQRSAFGLVDV